MLASALKKHRIPVAIYMDKSPALAEAMLGVLYSGNFYVVLDTQMPVERVHRILKHYSKLRFLQTAHTLIK